MSVHMTCLIHKGIIKYILEVSLSVPCRLRGEVDWEEDEELSWDMSREFAMLKWWCKESWMNEFRVKSLDWRYKLGVFRE